MACLSRLKAHFLVLDRIACFSSVDLISLLRGVAQDQFDVGFYPLTQRTLVIICCVVLILWFDLFSVPAML